MLKLFLRLHALKDWLSDRAKRKTPHRFGRVGGVLVSTIFSFFVAYSTYAVEAAATTATTTATTSTAPTAAVGA